MTPTPHELNERIKLVTGYDQSFMASELGRLTKEREDAKANLDYLREMRKVMLDTAALDWAAAEERRAGKRPSDARAEREGRTTNLYKTQLDAIKQAHQLWGSLFSQTKQIEAEQMAATMQISFYKAELNHR
jgi:hypothetical protein